MICGSFFPVCEVAYSTLEPMEYAKRVLLDKPQKIEKDDFLDSLYSRIAEESRSGKDI